MKLSEQAKAAQREYNRQYRAKRSEAAIEKNRLAQKEWRAKNKEKIKLNKAAYWERKALRLSIETEESRVIALKEVGMSLRKIAKELHISHMKVSRILKDCNKL